MGNEYLNNYYSTTRRGNYQTQYDGQNRCKRCNRPLSDPTQAYGPYCAQLLGIGQKNVIADTSTETALSHTDTGDFLKLDSRSLKTYNAYIDRYFPEISKTANVTWGESIADWFTKRLNDVKWAFKTIGNYANETQKKAQRSVWASGAEYYLRRKLNYLTSAWMLEHSLQDNPDDIWRGNDSRIAYLINHDENFSKEVNTAILNSDGKELKNKKITVAFADGDLYYSIHRADIYLNGYKQNNRKWIIHCNLYDTYDFTEIMTFMNSDGGWSKDVTKGTIANDAAVISQTTGAINPYNVEVDFWITR